MNASDHKLGRDAADTSLGDFDPRSGSLGERLIFNNRVVILVLCLLITAVLGLTAAKVRLNANFERMIPTGHPFIANYLANKTQLTGLGNSLRIAVVAKKGDIYNREYLATLQKISDDVFLLPGVDRPFMKSLWTPTARWMGVTEEGLDGGPLIGPSYDGSEQALRELRANVDRSGEIGQLVALDGTSSLIYVPLLSTDPATGKPIDYAALSAGLEQIRAKYASQGAELHIIGFAKLVGDLIDGLRQMLLFFVAAIALAATVLYAYTRCVRSTLLVVACSLVAVVWQLGLLPLLGFELDPYSVLVPFLVFAIGMSHGAQKMNGIMQDIGRGADRLVAARYTFRRLFLAGVTALLCDAVGFGVLLAIDIKVIRDLALIASIGVAALIFTNLILLPVLLSFVGVSPAAAARSLAAETASNDGGKKHPFWQFLDLFTQRKWATVTAVGALVLAVIGYFGSLQLKVGDLDPGAPELRADSRYNRDNAFIAANYTASSDVFAIMVKTPDAQCAAYDTLMRVDALDWLLRQTPGVDFTVSLASINRQLLTGMNEGDMRWYDVIQNAGTLNAVTAAGPKNVVNDNCNLLTIYAYLKDHKAETLEGVVRTAQRFITDNATPGADFRLAAGNAGIEAATNSVIAAASREMLYWVYSAVILLCLITFRSWRAVVCAVLPLMLTSVLCEALMARLGMGVKVATLPVIALGVGIGIDYALYVMSVLLTRMRAGESLSQAYFHALLFTGKVVLLTGVTLAVGVSIWAFSPIKFQADMGILLAFMFLWNMLGALILLPALAHFLIRPEGTKPLQSPERKKKNVPSYS